jgi:glucose-1-phosphate cytidylyltransferase
MNMKTIILAGGLGTRLAEESQIRPKPMVEIGGRPILWHIMKIYSAFGLNEFIICCGYKGYIIKEYFANYFLHTSDVTFDLTNNDIKIHQNNAEPWKVTLVDTGESSMTGGRIKRIKDYLGNEDFCMTYGDGVGNIDIKALIEFHKTQRTLATVTATQPPGRFGAMDINKEGKVTQFKEKPQGDNTWINGGFFVLSPKVLDLIENDQTVFEKYPMEELSRRNQLSAYLHNGFWQPMDTLRDKNYLEDLWQSGKAPWKTWK